jgi:hypothetical protein
MHRLASRRRLTLASAHRRHEGGRLVGFDAAGFEAAFGHLSPSPPESANGSHAEPFIGQVDLMTHRLAPQGWARCDGCDQWIEGEQAAFSVIGLAYGGDGISTFRLPDLPPLGPNGPYFFVALRGRFPNRS